MPGRAVASILFAWLATLLPAAAQQPAAASSGAEPAHFLVLSDIHFDPFADPALVPQLVAAPVEEWRSILARGSGGFAPFGTDANFALLASALEAAARTGLRYDYVVVAGDFLGHNFELKFNALARGGDYRAFVQKTMLFLAATLQERFSGVPVIGTFGNNDSECGDYAIPPDSALLPPLARAWGVLRDNPDARAEFLAGGSYALPHPTVPKHRFLVINDIYWSAKYRDCEADRPSGAPAMLAWLEWRLFQASLAGEKVTLVFHIPPGIDAYASAHGKGSCQAATTGLWTRESAVRFLEIVDRARGVLAPSIAGHTHMDEMRLVSSAEGEPLLPIKIFPSISPIFGNAPAFTIGVYDRADGAIRDFRIVGLTNLAELAKPGTAEPRWTGEYAFAEAYGVSGFDAASVAQITGAMDSESVRATFARYYAGVGAKTSPITDSNWRAFTCAQDEIGPSNYTACHCNGG